MANRTSTAQAHWERSTIAGSGTVSTESGVLRDAPLTWRSRIGEEAGATPEELLAAAHAGCFAMAFSFALTNDGHEPTQLDVGAECAFGPMHGGGFEVKSMHLTVQGDVPGIDEARFGELAEQAKVGCPVSKAFAGNLEITLEARLRQNVG